MLKAKEKVVICIVTLIILSIVTITAIFDIKYYIILSLALTILMMYFTMLFTLTRTMIKRDAYFKDLDSLFSAGEGELVVEDGSPLIKLLSINSERIHYSQHKSKEETRQVLKGMLISIIVPPTLSFITYALISYYRSYPFTALQIMFWLTIVFYVAFFLVFLIVFIATKFENKKAKLDFCTITKIRENKISIQIYVISAALVKNSQNNTLEIDLDTENIDLIIIGSLGEEIKNNWDELPRLIKILHKLTRRLVKYPNSLRIDLTDTRIRIVRTPDYKDYKEKKSTLFLSNHQKGFTEKFLEHLKIWVNN